MADLEWPCLRALSPQGYRGMTVNSGLDSIAAQDKFSVSAAQIAFRQGAFRDDHPLDIKRFIGIEWISTEGWIDLQV